jgi:uncharacterized protein (AIM24 family)
MQYKILKEPMAMLEIQLNNEEQLTAEAGAMVYIKGNIEVKTTLISSCLCSSTFHIQNGLFLHISKSLVCSCCS